MSTGMQAGPKGFKIAGTMCAVAMAAAAVTVGQAAPESRHERQRSQTRAQRSDDNAPRETETVDRTIAIPSNGKLRVRNFSGTVHVVGTNGHDVVLKATRRAPRERLDHVKLDVSTSGNTVTIEANKQDEAWERARHDNNVVETSMELQVPASVALDLEVFSSDVTVDGMNGDQRLKTFSGTLAVLNPGAAVDAETFSGDIRVGLPKSAKGKVSFSSFSGTLDSALGITSSSWRKRSVDGTLPGGDGASLKFHTFSGDVRITEK